MSVDVRDGEVRAQSVDPGASAVTEGGDRWFDLRFDDQSGLNWLVLSAFVSEDASGQLPGRLAGRGHVLSHGRVQGGGQWHGKTDQVKFTFAVRPGEYTLFGASDHGDLLPDFPPVSVRPAR